MVIFAIILALVVATFLGLNQLLSTPIINLKETIYVQQTPTIIPTSLNSNLDSWLTYQTADCCLTLKYPKGANVFPFSALKISDNGVVLYLPPKYGHSTQGQSSRIDITVLASKVDFENYIQNNVGLVSEISVDGPRRRLDRLIINGRNAYQQPDYPSGDKLKSNRLYIGSGGYVYMVNLQSDLMSQELKVLYYQLVGTIEATQ